MTELKTDSSSLPVLPLSLRSSFASLPGGVRVVVRGYFRKIFDLLWPFTFHVDPSRSPMSFVFLLPEVLTRLGFNIQGVGVLSCVFFLSDGGKRGVVTLEVAEVTKIKHIYYHLSKLQKAGYLRRSHFDPANPLPSKEKFIQHRYLFITAEGIQVLKSLNGAFRSDFYGVINRAAFGPENCNNKNPGPTK